jgi:sporulation protein YlmC with PRC-barrel domain
VVLSVASIALSVGLSAADPACNACTKNQPARFNKATGIIGMQVVNPKSQRLGEIKDVVFDLKTERVAYVVLATDSTPQKLLAVPMSALTPTGDSAHLVLKADEAKIASAKGISEGNWPAPVSPVWGAQVSQSAPRTSLPRR